MKEFSDIAKEIIISILEFIKTNQNQGLIQKKITDNVFKKGMTPRKQTVTTNFNKIKNAGLVTTAKINEKKCYTLTEKGEAFLQNQNFEDLFKSINEEQHIPLATNQKAPNRSDKRKRSGIDPQGLFKQSMNDLIERLKERPCFSGYKKEIIFELDDVSSVSFILNKVRSMSRNHVRGLDRFFGLGKYLLICSDNDFNDLQDDVKNFLKSRKPAQFKDYREDLLKSIEKNLKNLPRKTDPDRNYMTRIINDYVLQKNAFRGLDIDDEKLARNAKRRNERDRMARLKKKLKKNPLNLEEPTVANEVIVGTETLPASTERDAIEYFYSSPVFHSEEAMDTLSRVSRSEKMLTEGTELNTTETLPDPDLNFQPLLPSEQTNFKNVTDDNENPQEDDEVIEWGEVKWYNV